MIPFGHHGTPMRRATLGFRPGAAGPSPHQVKFRAASHSVRTGRALLRLLQGTAQAPRGNPDLRGTAKTTDAVFVVGWFAMLAVAAAASIDRLALLLSAPPS